MAQEDEATMERLAVTKIGLNLLSTPAPANRTMILRSPCTTSLTEIESYKKAEYSAESTFTQLLASSHPHSYALSQHFLHLGTGSRSRRRHTRSTSEPDLRSPLRLVLAS